jgi:hypothetical protein
MAVNVPKKIWVYVERLFICQYSVKDFKKLLKEFDVIYNNKIYRQFDSTKVLYTFMSEENYAFADFMQTVPKYKYLPILERVVFDSKIIGTKNDGWNYYGEHIKHWYPTVMEMLKISDIKVDRKSQKLVFKETEYIPSGDDFLPYPFNDPFLDYIRKEINESYKGRLFLSTMFLSRKLLEAIFTRVLEIVFPKLISGKYSESNHNIWYNKTRNSYRDFSELIENAKTSSKSFQEDKDLIEELCAFVKPFKDETNSNVHNDYKIPDENYINQWKTTHIINMARKVYKKYCNP